MKKSDEIKEGQKLCLLGTACGRCPYYNVGHGVAACMGRLTQDTLDYIQQLETEDAQKAQRIAVLEQELADAKQERDSAVSELPHNCWNCKYHSENPIEETDDSGRTIHRYCEADCCYPDEENSSWLWRGVCSENTEVKEDV